MKALVVLLALLLLAWLLFGSTRRRGRDARQDSAQAPRSNAAPVEDMVACAHCGVHLPTSLALQAQGRSFCSAAHRDAGPRAL
jgi:uncharacterized protein